MYHTPRRPYYNRNNNMPQSTNDDSVSIDNKRFWSLLKNLRRRQEDAKEKKEPAQSAK